MRTHPAHDALVAAELSAFTTLLTDIDMAPLFAEMDPLERRAYLDADAPVGFAEYEKPLWWVSRLVDEAYIYQPFTDAEDTARRSFDVDHRTGGRFGWSPERFEMLLDAVGWLRGTDDASEAAATMNGDPVTLRLRHDVAVTVTVDVVDWFAALPVERRADAVAARDDTADEDFFERPYRFLVDEFADGVDLEVVSRPHVDMTYESLDVHDRVSHRGGTSMFRSSVYWREDDFTVLADAEQWLLDAYFETFAADLADPEHDDHEAYLDYVARRDRIPGPFDVPLFDAA